MSKYIDRDSRNMTRGLDRKKPPSRPPRRTLRMMGWWAAVAIPIAAVSCGTGAASHGSGTPHPAAAHLPAGTIAQFTGHGSKAETARFIVPEPGDYRVIWSYSGNSTLGAPDAFIMLEDETIASMTANPLQQFANPSSQSLPNDTAASGHGSEYTYGDPGSHFFSVDASGTWTITVITEP